MTESYALKDSFHCNLHLRFYVGSDHTSMLTFSDILRFVVWPGWNHTMESSTKNG